MSCTGCSCNKYIYLDIFLLTEIVHPVCENGLNVVVSTLALIHCCKHHCGSEDMQGENAIKFLGSGSSSMPGVQR